METKKCTTCKIEQPITEYRVDNSRKNNIHPTCNNCNKEIQRRWYLNNKEKAQTTASLNYHKKKDLINTKRKEARLADPEKFRAAARNRYNPITGKVNSWKNAGIKNMTYDRYIKMLETQNNCCEICGKHKDEFKRNLDVDHDHITGEARGLLCTPCNSGIGKLKDSIEMLEKALLYLKKYE